MVPCVWPHVPVTLRLWPDTSVNGPTPTPTPTPTPHATPLLISVPQPTDFLNLSTVSQLLARGMWKCPIPQAMTASSGNRTTGATVGRRPDLTFRPCSLCCVSVSCACRQVTDMWTLVYVWHRKIQVTCHIFIVVEQLPIVSCCCFFSIATEEHFLAMVQCRTLKPGGARGRSPGTDQGHRGEGHSCRAACDNLAAQPFDTLRVCWEHLSPQSSLQP